MCVSVVPALAQSKLPVPGANDQEKAMGVVRDVYRDEFQKAESPGQKEDLAKKLLQRASETANATERYALLRVARDTSIEAGGATAFHAVDAMALGFQIDGLEMNTNVLAKYASVATSSTQKKAIAEKAVSLIDVALREDNLNAASRLADMAVSAAQKARDAGLTNQSAALNSKIVELLQANADAKLAFAALQTNATDPAANLTVGKYYCFLKGDWDKGLPMLARGNDPILRELAARELHGVSDAAEQVALGDRWWDLAETVEASQTQKEEMLLRAGCWYAQAAPKLSGLPKDKVAKRLATIQETGRLGPRSLQTTTVDQSTVPAATNESQRPLPAGPQGEPIQYEVADCSWTTGQPEVRMISPKTGFCFLSSVGGDFLGSGEWTRVYVAQDRLWHLAGKGLKRIDSMATAIQFVSPNPFNPRVEEYSWRRGATRVKMIHKNDGFCFLSAVGGGFRGAAESVTVSIGDDGYWYLDGTAKELIGASAIAVRTVAPGSFHPEILQYKWERGSPPIRMLYAKEGFCVLSGIYGGFHGGGEWVKVSLEADGFWCLRGHSFPLTGARAIGFRFSKVQPSMKVVMRTSEAEGQTWRYTMEKPVDGWYEAGFDASRWRQGAGGFGKGDTPGSVVRTEWTCSDIWIRREFSVQTVPVHPYLIVHHDEDAEVYINGIPAAKLSGITGRYEPAAISLQAAASLKAGENTIAVHCHQTAGGQYIDAGIADTFD
jgi:hypothetical protein